MTSGEAMKICLPADVGRGRGIYTRHTNPCYKDGVGAHIAEGLV